MEDLRTLLERLAGKGVFGDGTLESVESEHGDISFQFASALCMLKIVMRRTSGQPETLNIVVKKHADHEFFNSTINKKLFSNEIIMYKEILPFLSEREFQKPYTQFYYGRTGDKDGIVIIQNFKPFGFVNCEARVFLDQEHLVLSMKTIGKMHSWSYSAKKKDFEKLKTLSAKLQPIIQGEHMDNDIFEFYRACSHRGISRLIDKSSDEESLKKFSKACEDAVKMHKFFWKPVEPCSVVIHGDFCKSNMVYKYDPSGKPIDAALFDFQHCKYSSAALDLSLFLYMHTTAEVREAHWDELLKVYWESVKENVSKDVTLPSFEEFLNDFATRAAYGYLHVAYYLPFTYSKDPSQAGEVVAGLDTKEKAIQFLFTVGGEQGDKLVVDVLSHLVEKGYIKKFVDSFFSSEFC